MPAGLTSTFDVIPAIDLRGGRVVRLEQGDFEREAVFDSDPVARAIAFRDAGARWIHVVDLDGAVAGERRQATAVAAIVEATARDGTVNVQVAGGLRDAASIAAALATGARRVVVGTAALRHPAILMYAARRHGADRVALALDVRDGSAVGGGWIPGAPARPFRDVLGELGAAGPGTVIVTAVARDGLLGGPDLELLAGCVEATPAAVIASGGIRSIDDLRAVRAIGCSGAIVGRAIYDGRLDLRAALIALAGAGEPTG